MPRKPGFAKYTAHLATAVKPEMKDALGEVAKKYETDPSTVARWAIQNLLNRDSAGESVREVLEGAVQG